MNSDERAALVERVKDAIAFGMRDGARIGVDANMRDGSSDIGTIIDAQSVEIENRIMPIIALVRADERKRIAAALLDGLVNDDLESPLHHAMSRWVARDFNYRSQYEGEPDHKYSMQSAREAVSDYLHHIGISTEDAQ